MDEVVFASVQIDKRCFSCYLPVSSLVFYLFTKLFAYLFVSPEMQKNIENVLSLRNQNNDRVKYNLIYCYRRIN